MLLNLRECRGITRLNYFQPILILFQEIHPEILLWRRVNKNKSGLRGSRNPLQLQITTVQYTDRRESCKNIYENHKFNSRKGTFRLVEEQVFVFVSAVFNRWVTQTVKGQCKPAHSIWYLGLPLGNESLVAVIEFIPISCDTTFTKVTVAFIG